MNPIHCKEINKIQRFTLNQKKKKRQPKKYPEKDGVRFRAENTPFFSSHSTENYPSKSCRSLMDKAIKGC